MSRYNPFKNLNDEINSDQILNENSCSYTGDLSKASKVLDKCGNFESKDASQFLNDDQNKFNTYFYNGNKSNYNVFTAELTKLQGNFSIIGICETNVNSDQKDLYCLQDHNSFYSDKLECKKSGTGIAIYVHEKFNAIKNIVVSTTRPHLECIFLKVTKGKLNMNAGLCTDHPTLTLMIFLSEL